MAPSKMPASHNRAAKTFVSKKGVSKQPVSTAAAFKKATSRKPKIKDNAESATRTKLTRVLFPLVRRYCELTDAKLNYARLANVIGVTKRTIYNHLSAARELDHADQPYQVGDVESAGGLDVLCGRLVAYAQLCELDWLDMPATASVLGVKLHVARSGVIAAKARQETAIVEPLKQDKDRVARLAELPLDSTKVGISSSSMLSPGDLPSVKRTPQVKVKKGKKGPKAPKLKSKSKLLEYLIKLEPEDTAFICANDPMKSTNHTTAITDNQTKRHRRESPDSSDEWSEKPVKKAVRSIKQVPAPIYIAPRPENKAKITLTDNTPQLAASAVAIKQQGQVSRNTVKDNSAAHLKATRQTLPMAVQRDQHGYILSPMSFQLEQAVKNVGNGHRRGQSIGEDEDFTNEKFAGSYPAGYGGGFHTDVYAKAEASREFYDNGWHYQGEFTVEDEALDNLVDDKFGGSYPASYRGEVHAHISSKAVAGTPYYDNGYQSFIEAGPTLDQSNEEIDLIDMTSPLKSDKDDIDLIDLASPLKSGTDEIDLIDLASPLKSGTDEIDLIDLTSPLNSGFSFDRNGERQNDGTPAEPAHVYTSHEEIDLIDLSSPLKSGFYYNFNGETRYFTTPPEVEVIYHDCEVSGVRPVGEPFPEFFDPPMTAYLNSMASRIVAGPPVEAARTSLPWPPQYHEAVWTPPVTDSVHSSFECVDEGGESTSKIKAGPLGSPFTEQGQSTWFNCSQTSPAYYGIEGSKSTSDQSLKHSQTLPSFEPASPRYSTTAPSHESTSPSYEPASQDWEWDNTKSIWIKRPISCWTNVENGAETVAKLASPLTFSPIAMTESEDMPSMTSASSASGSFDSTDRSPAAAQAYERKLYQTPATNFVNGFPTPAFTAESHSAYYQTPAANSIVFPPPLLSPFHEELVYSSRDQMSPFATPTHDGKASQNPMPIFQYNGPSFTNTVLQDTHKRSMQAYWEAAAAEGTAYWDGFVHTTDVANALTDLDSKYMIISRESLQACTDSTQALVGALGLPISAEMQPGYMPRR